MPVENTVNSPALLCTQYYSFTKRIPVRHSILSPISNDEISPWLRYLSLLHTVLILFYRSVMSRLFCNRQQQIGQIHYNALELTLLARAHSVGFKLNFSPLFERLEENSVGLFSGLKLWSQILLVSVGMYRLYTMTP